MTAIAKEEHRQAHIRLHCSLDELVADWILQTGNLPSKSTVLEFIIWSSKQTKNPEDKDNDKDKQEEIRL